MSQDPVPYILNLSIAAMSHSSTPATRDRARRLLKDITACDPDEPSEPSPMFSNGQTWWEMAREACPNWLEL